MPRNKPRPDMKQGCFEKKFGLPKSALHVKEKRSVSEINKDTLNEK